LYVLNKFQDMNHVTNFREQFYRSFTFTDNTKWNSLGESFFLHLLVFKI
jgi:hypothetical protein